MDHVTPLLAYGLYGASYRGLGKHMDAKGNHG